MSHQQIEHQTGLILVDAATTTSTNTCVIAADSPRLQPAVIKALRSLRDNNPSLQRKLDHSIDDSTAAIDESLGYWNRYQEMVILSPDNKELIGVNLGGLMVRLVNCVPFFQVLKEEKVTSLTTVNFGGTDVGMDNLLEGVKLLSEDATQVSITDLYLGGCGIGCRKGTKYLKEVLQLLSTNIKTLDLRYNDLEGQDLEDLASAISAASNLNILHLEGNYGKCQGAAAIGKALSTSSNLKELYLGANQIGSMGAKSLADGLRNNRSLEKLYLEGNSIGDEGAVALRDVLLDQHSRQCKVLEHLYVDNNGLGKEAATTLGRAVNSETMIDGSLFDG